MLLNSAIILETSLIFRSWVNELYWSSYIFLIIIYYLCYNGLQFVWGFLTRFKNWMMDYISTLASKELILRSFKYHFCNILEAFWSILTQNRTLIIAVYHAAKNPKNSNELILRYEDLWQRPMRPMGCCNIFEYLGHAHTIPKSISE